MSLHFVTSAQAEDHVSSSDEARKTEGMIGTGGFVLGTKDKLSASMIDANTLRILEGDLIFCGRQVNITNYEEVTIQNGTPGMNSIALVVLNMKTDPSEEATIKVYEGTETDGDPVMPEYIEGDLNNGDTEAEMPLYAITKTGLSVGDPVAQFDIWVSEKEFRTSIGQISASSDTLSIGDNTIGQFAVDFDLPDGYIITSIKGWRTSQIAMLGVDGISLSGSTANVVVRNHGARRNGSVTVTVSVAKI